MVRQLRHSVGVQYMTHRDHLLLTSAIVATHVVRPLQKMLVLRGTSLTLDNFKKWPNSSVNIVLMNGIKIQLYVDQHGSRSLSGKHRGCKQTRRGGFDRCYPGLVCRA